MVKLRKLATLTESFRNEHGFYPLASNITELNDALGQSSGRWSREDGWARDFVFRYDKSSYTIISLGRDGALQPDPPGGKTGDMDADIIYSMGRFIQWPEGRQY